MVIRRVKTEVATVDELGLPAILKDLAMSRRGLALLVGATGSGKSTTLAAMIDHRNSSEPGHIITIEDPIEFVHRHKMSIVTQREVGFDTHSFQAALKNTLRQAPDVIMIGEIRDLETAQIAVQAALTGHLVLSTLHTNSAASTVTRLLDMGVENFLVTSTVIGVLAQRLVRKLCPHCRVPYPVGRALAESALAALGTDAIPQALYRPGGCNRCNGTGYHGRSVAFELLDMSAAVRRAVLDSKDEDQIERRAGESGMRTLYADALAKAADGVTSLEEVLRVTREA
jgi:general secretion pathway protein E